MRRARYDAVLLSPKDNVICLLRSMKAGDHPLAEGMELPALLQDTSLGHKVARTNIQNGAPVLKYGEIIGQTTRAIAAGEHVHLHNLAGLLQTEVEAK